MQLINSTCVPARLSVSRLFPATDRIGALVAKATFRMERGGPVIEREEPYPIWDEDQETALGVLPRDDVPRRDPAFEVILLGVAHAPSGEPVTEQVVSLAVGHERRELVVVGDREWQERRISAAAPFSRMPLTWRRAFGGAREVEVDAGAFLTVTEPHNAHGRGFDPAPAAHGLGNALCSPPGYPVFDASRQLPNLEDPAARIQAWDDAPAPVCWAPVPLDSAIQARRSVAWMEEEGSAPVELLESAHHRAHPDWVIALPPAGVDIELHGLRPEGLITFKLPALRVFADYEVELRTGARELRPQVLVLLPEERRFYLVYRTSFTFPYPGGERSMRLRVEDGWWQSTQRES